MSVFTASRPPFRGRLLIMVTVWKRRAVLVSTGRSFVQPRRTVWPINNNILARRVVVTRSRATLGLPRLSPRPSTATPRLRSGTRGSLPRVPLRRRALVRARSSRDAARRRMLPYRDAARRRVLPHKDVVRLRGLPHKGVRAKAVVRRAMLPHPARARWCRQRLG